jgi:transcription elongation GreA/GreB family factor
MTPEDIIVDDKTPYGTKVLKEYLDYAKKGILVSTDDSLRDFDSDFEISVAEQIKSWDFEVKPQHGVAGYFIDLVVKHPNRPGEFLAAIECDGASYHTGVSVRDRDRIRQEILESMGWKGKIYRIWSTDWFYIPREAAKKLKKFLDERIEQSDNEQLGYEDLIDDNYDDSELSTEENLKDYVVNQDLNFEVAVEEDLYVEVGDRVTYSPIENPEEKNTVLIVDEGESNLKFGVLKEDSPLAKALLGLTVGEIAKLNLKTNQKDVFNEFKLIKIDKS